jgi:acetyl esterase/lipase
MAACFWDLTMNLTLFALAVSFALASEPVPVEFLWPNGAPDAKGTEEKDKPALTIYLPLPDKANGTAVVVCPGGGYAHLADDHEGKQPAEWLNQHGVAAFVLRYRHAPEYRHPVPMHDVQRAIRLVRVRAKDWHVDPEKIGVWGFSAGGHLASTAATHFDAGRFDTTDPVEHASCRPNFAILCYPVITFLPPFAHRGSRDNLLGKAAVDQKLVLSLCNDQQVTAGTPPTFLFATDEDRAVPPGNSVLFYLALKKAGVPAELHIYQKGKHGVGLAPKDPVLSTWTARLEDWMKARGLLPE